ncbi:hypothetical protein ACFLWF_00390 [Chloroflexota bacterium]
MTKLVFEDVKVNVKIILAALWTAHFLLWTFGDMASLLQEISRPIADNLLLFVGVPTAVIQALMIFFSLVGKAKVMRRVSIIVALAFVGLNIGFMVDSHTGWEYLLGTAYLLFNVLIIWYAWKWPKQEG